MAPPYLLKVDVAHVDTQSARLWVLLVLNDQRVRAQRFLVHAVQVVLHARTGNNNNNNTP